MASGGYGDHCFTMLRYCSLRAAHLACRATGGHAGRGREHEALQSQRRHVTDGDLIFLLQDVNLRCMAKGVAIFQAPFLPWTPFELVLLDFAGGFECSWW